jgi:hypothetical protein
MASPVWIEETSCFGIKMSQTERSTNCTHTQNQPLPCFRMAGRLRPFYNRPDVRLYHNLIWWTPECRTTHSGVVGAKTLE